MKKVFFVSLFFLATLSLAGQVHISKITVGNQFVEANYNISSEININESTPVPCGNYEEMEVYTEHKDPFAQFLNIADFVIEPQFYEQTTWNIIAGLYEQRSYSYGGQNGLCAMFTNAEYITETKLFTQFTVRLYKTSIDASNIIYEQNIFATPIAYFPGLSNLGSGSKYKSNELNIPVTSELLNAIYAAPQTIVLELVPIDSEGTYTAATLTLKKPSHTTIYQIDEMANSTIINTKTNTGIKANESAPEITLESCTSNQFDLYFDGDLNNTTISAAKINNSTNTENLTTKIDKNKLSVTFPEGKFYYNGEEDVEIRTVEYGVVKVYKFNLRVSQQNPFYLAKELTTVTATEKESCNDILFTVNVENGSYTDLNFLTSTTYVSNSDYYTADKTVKLAPRNSYCQYNEYSLDLTGDQLIRTPEVKILNENYCAYSDGVKVELLNEVPYPMNVEVFAEIDGTKNIVVGNGTIFKTGIGAHNVKFYARANHLQGCIAYSNSTFTVNEYAAPVPPELSGNLYDCGVGTTLTHSNPQYGVQYWLYDPSNNLIKHKGANFWLFREDQYDPLDGKVHPDAHWMLDLRGGKYKIVATHDLNSCETVKDIEIVNQQIQINLSPRAGAITRCQSDENYNLFDLFEPGTIRDGIENNRDGITYRFEVADGNVAVPVIATKLVNTAALEANKNYKVALTIIAANGCSKIVERDFTVISRPTAFTVTSTANNLLCNGESWPLSVSSSQYGITYAWFIDGIQKGTGNTLSSGALSPGNHTAYAIGRNSAGCETKSNTISVAANQVNNTAAISPELASLCQADRELDLFEYLTGSAADINALKAKNGVNYNFVFSSGGPVIYGTTGSKIDLSTATANVNPYTLTLTVAQNNCTRVYTKEILIKARPAEFTITSDIDEQNENVCDGLAWTLNIDSPVAGTTYTWHLDGTQSSQGVNFSATGLFSGQHNAYAIGRNAAGCEMKSDIQTATARYFGNEARLDGSLIELCQADKEIDVFDFVIGSETDIAALKAKNNITYSFAFSAGGPVIYGPGLHTIDLSNQSAVNVNPHVLTLVLYQNGCTRTFTKEVLIKARPEEVNIASSAGSLLCNGESWPLAVNTPQSGVTYAWFIDGAEKGAGNTLSSGTLSPGNHTAYAIGRNAAGCETKSNTISVTANEVTSTAAISPELASLCQADRELDLFEYLTGAPEDIEALKANNNISYSFTFSAGGPVIYGPSGNKIDLSSVTANVNPYTLTLTVAQNNCTRVYTKEILIKARPEEVNIASSAGSLLCNGESWPLAVNTPQSGVTYAWFIDGAEKGTGNTLSSGALSPGNHTAYAIGRIAAGCETKSNTISVTANEVTSTAAISPELASLCQTTTTTEFDLFNYITGSAADINALKAKNGVNYNFVFSSGGPVIYGTTGSKINLHNAPANVNPYTLTLTVSQNNCTRVYTKEVLIKPLPAAFTLTTDNTTVCNTPQITLQANNVSAGATLRWYADGSLFSTGSPGGITTNHSRQGANVTNYSAIADLAGCTLNSSNTVSVERKVVDFSQIGFDSSPISECQDDKQINLFDFVSGADKSNVQYTYNGWGRDFTSAPDGLTLSLDGIITLSSSVATGATPYTVTLRVHKDGCYTSFTKPIAIRQRPNLPTLSTNANNLCEGAKATITATGTASNYEWYKDGVKVDNGTAQYVHVEPGTQSSTEYYAIGVTDFTAAACRSQASQPITITSNAPIGEFKMSKTCYSPSERPVITTTGTSNIGGITVKATHVNSGYLMNIELDGGYTFKNIINSPNQSWDITATVTSTNGCSKPISLGVISISNACPTSYQNTYPDYFSYTAAAAMPTVCPDCPDCEEIRQINDELESIYNNYLQQWKSSSQYKALLSPTVTTNGEQLTVNIHATGMPGTVQIHLFDVVGTLLSVKTATIYEGENKVDISEIFRPAGQLYMVRISYPNGNSEILKGLTK